MATLIVRFSAAARRWPTALVAIFLWGLAASALAQGNAQPQGNRGLNAVGDFGIGPGGVGVGNDAGGDPARGGAASADFDSLIDLITSTVEADSWEENGTGEGEIMEFAINGVYIDAAGALRVGKTQQQSLANVRNRGINPSQRAGSSPTPASSSTNLSVPPTNAAISQHQTDPRRASNLRYVSLPRLEAAIAARQRAHAPLDPAMLTLAGLQRVSYILVYPESGDLVLAGPAGDWQASAEGGIVAADTGRAIVRLDDLASLWRRQQSGKSGAFGCSIVPRQEALARTQEFINASAAQPLEPGQRRQWLAALRDTLGVQDVEYYNVDPNTRIAGVLLAADYHMKLVGMGLAPAVPGVKSYLATVRLGPGGQAPPMKVLRWWFSMPAATVEASAEHDAFAMPQRCVQVLSENEQLAALGKRVHTGESDALTKQFAESFTKEYTALVDKYPIYGQLERVFELALALAVIEKQGLPELVGWTPSLLVDGQRLRLPRVAAPRSVETVINHKVIGGRKIIAGISGGVWVDGGKSLTVADAQNAASGNLADIRKTPVALAKPAADKNVEKGQDIVWWWD
jgi:hypothetical protein